MDINDALNLSPDETRALPTDEKIKLSAEAWAQLSEEGKQTVVILSALSILAGTADLPVAFSIFELAEADGLDTPPWRELKDQIEAEDALFRSLASIFDDLAGELDTDE